MAFEGPFFVRLNGSTADHTAPGVGQLAQAPLAGESEPASALLAGHTVVLAASLGHSIAAQLGVDLLINTALEPRGSLRRIGFVSPEFTLPVVGNDVYLGSHGLMSLPIEVYSDAQARVTFIQQRSPILPHERKRFATELVNWVQQSGAARMLVAAPLDASFRRDAQLQSARQERVVLVGAEAPSSSWPASVVGVPQLESDVFPAVIGAGSFVRHMLREAEQRHLSLALLASFVAEGLDLPIAFHFATWINDALGSYLTLPQEAAGHEGAGLLVPQHWRFLVEPAHVHQELY